MSIAKLLILIAIVYFVMKAHQALKTTQGSGASPSPAAGPQQEHLSSAHEILGVSPGATQAEIKAAYQKLVQQYHPDRVADMGPELRAVAEQRTKEINAAYATLKHG